METVFRQLKVACGADVLRSKKPVGIRNEIAARITAVNLVRMIMIDAARKCGGEPTRLSFSAALRAIASTSLRMAAAPTRDLPLLYELMLHEIGEEVVPDRPDRNEPRAVCRERKHYPHLRGSRVEWRANRAAKVSAIRDTYRLLLDGAARTTSCAKATASGTSTSLPSAPTSSPYRFARGA
jgi:hypothetical protein